MGVPSVQQRALGFLARREHSRAELMRKLAGVDTPEAVRAALDRLEELDLQSDARMAQSYVRAKAGRMGVTRLRYELKQRGLDLETIEAALAMLGQEMGDEAARAQAVWATRFDQLPQDARTWARQARFLAGRGFSTAIIRRILKESFDDAA